MRFDADKVKDKYFTFRDEIENKGQTTQTLNDRIWWWMDLTFSLETLASIPQSMTMVHILVV